LIEDGAGEIKDAGGGTQIRSLQEYHAAIRQAARKSKNARAAFTVRPITFG